MATTVEAVLVELWKLVTAGADPKTLVLVNASKVATQVQATPEVVGQILTDLGCGRRKIRLASGQRTNMRTFLVRNLPPVQADRQTLETPTAETSLPAGILPKGFPIDPTCTRCYATLPPYMRALGICGDCLTVSQEDVQSIPGARYGGAQAQAQHDEPRMYGYYPVPVAPGYSHR